jgi:hypothetical protein
MIFKGMALAALGLLAAPSFAQVPAAGGDPDFSEMMCIYEELMILEDDEYYDVVDAHIQDVTEGDLFDSAYESIAPAIDSCTRQYKWDAERQEIALVVGVLGTVGDAIESELLDNGFTDAKLDELVNILDRLSVEDMLTIAGGTWRTDEPLKARIKGHLTALGYPQDQGLLNRGLFLVEAYVSGMVQMDAWFELTGQ